MKKVFLEMLILAVSTPAFADGILCSRDGRVVDGIYEEVKLEAKQGQKIYDLTRTVDSPGPKSQPEVSTLATDLKCKIDELVAYCFKSASDSGDKVNSVVTFQSIERTLLSSLEQKKAEKAGVEIEIVVGSPLTDGRKEYVFNVAQKFGGCKKIP
jgi:hypothetical protein